MRKQPPESERNCYAENKCNIIVIKRKHLNLADDILDHISRNRIRGDAGDLVLKEFGRQFSTKNLRNGDAFAAMSKKGHCTTKLSVNIVGKDQFSK
ncbi:hypothetical protein Ddc_11965 [Ditylenchus destructor]|nr:hypothetical protein Ddc_11965 [Ditylenchus destructor]